MRMEQTKMRTPEIVAKEIHDADCRFDALFCKKVKLCIADGVRSRDKEIAGVLRSSMRLSKTTYCINRPDRILELLESLEGVKKE